MTPVLHAPWRRGGCLKVGKHVARLAANVEYPTGEHVVQADLVRHDVGG